MTFAGMTYEEFAKSVAEHQPPQSWFDEDFSGLRGCKNTMNKAQEFIETIYKDYQFNNKKGLNIANSIVPVMDVESRDNDDLFIEFADGSSLTITTEQL